MPSLSRFHPSSNDLMDHTPILRLQPRLLGKMASHSLPSSISFKRNISPDLDHPAMANRCSSHKAAHLSDPQDGTKVVVQEAARNNVKKGAHLGLSNVGGGVHDKRRAYPAPTCRSPSLT
jgi:hypothetical protein